MTDSLPPPLPKPPKPLFLPVVLAFVPSVLALGLTMASAYGDIAQSQMVDFCVLAAVVSIACCAVSSAMLFKRNTTAALVFGVLLAMLNVLISAGLGCAAMLAGTSFR